MPLRFLNPNLHVILIHYPLGVFVLGVFLEMFSFLWRKSSIRTAARWMIAIGAFLTLPAATSGLYALYQVKGEQGLTDASYHMLRLHVILMGSASILAVFCALIGVGASDLWRRRLYLPLLIGVIGAWGLMVAGAWRGGETIYQNGTSVAIVRNEEGRPMLQPDLHDVADPVIPKTAQGTIDPEEQQARMYARMTNFYGGSLLQQHLVVSGFSFAIAIGALALAIRRVHSESLAHDLIELPRPPMKPERRSGTNDLSVLQSFNPGTEVGPAPLKGVIPSGRFWLLAAMTIIATAGLGYWMMTERGVLTKPAFDDFVKELYVPGEQISRYMAHLILGGAFLLLTLICALLAVAAPKRPLLLGFFATLMILVIAAQVWMGVLLSFDGSKGPLNKFKDPKMKKHHEEPAESIETPATLPTTLPATEPTTEPAK